MAHEEDAWAAQLLAADEAPNPSDPSVIEAVKRLLAPLEHQPGVFSTGTNAIEDSLLVRAMPSPQLEAIVEEQLRRARASAVGPNCLAEGSPF
jgi:hypothetical protein